jgi:hypothetical protein
MRIALLAIASFLMLTSAASAQGRAPFCSRATEAGDVIQCNFYSMAACQFDVRGRGGYCIRNPAMEAMGRYQARRYRR